MKRSKEWPINRSNSFNRLSIPASLATGTPHRAPEISRIQLGNYKAGINTTFPGWGRRRLQVSACTGPIRWKRGATTLQTKKFHRYMFVFFIVSAGSCLHRSLSLYSARCLGSLLPDEGPEIRPRGCTALESFYRAAQARGLQLLPRLFFVFRAEPALTRSTKS